MSTVGNQLLNPFEILKATTLALLAALLFSLGSATRPTSLMAYMLFSAIMALQGLEMFAPVLSEKTSNILRQPVFLRISTFVQLLLASGLVAATDGSGSVYELVYLLPIISAATKLPGQDVVFVVVSSIIAMVGFIVTGEQLTPSITRVKEFQDAVAAIVYFTMAGLLVYFFAKGEREQRERFQALAATLAQTNTDLRQAQSQLTERLTQVTKMEDRLQQVSQMAVLGEMAGQVAHEVRNPLGIIRGSVHMLAERVSDPAIQRHVEVLLEETGRLNKAVEGVLRLGAPLRITRAPVSLSQVLESVIAVSSAWSLPAGLRITLRASSPGLTVRGDFDLLHQAFGNFIRNACQAMPSGGVVTVRQYPPEENGSVLVAIIDNGVGIAEEDLKRLGDPFFTKRRGGVGLGFSLARRVVVEHGGSLQVTSTPGRGTTVTVSFPLSSRAHERVATGLMERRSY
jgi:signal transduction histidine kinase